MLCWGLDAEGRRCEAEKKSTAVPATSVWHDDLTRGAAQRLTTNLRMPEQCFLEAQGVKVPQLDSVVHAARCDHVGTCRWKSRGEQTADVYHVHTWPSDMVFDQSGWVPGLLAVPPGWGATKENTYEFEQFSMRKLMFAQKCMHLCHRQKFASPPRMLDAFWSVLGHLVCLGRCQPGLCPC